MFKNRKEQLADLELAYDAFMQTAKGLSPEALMKPLGDWTPRDILAHFIGWNRITLAGCAEICEGIEPFYFYDGTNDYRKVNASFLSRFNSTDRDILLNQIQITKDALVPYLWTIPASRRTCHRSALCRLAHPRLRQTQRRDRFGYMITS
ncbi:MAG: hypothetical protein HZB50_09745 [Chloroflexi bacterium]|nr:hypothetical protein [Chloroflexota bacterium]